LCRHFVGGPNSSDLMSTARLADGMVIRTSLIARLLGIRLLRVEGTISVVPRFVDDATTLRPSVPGRVVRSTVISADPGAGLAEARRLLRDAEDDLESLARGADFLVPPRVGST